MTPSPTTRELEELAERTEREAERWEGRMKAGLLYIARRMRELAAALRAKTIKE